MQNITLKSLRIAAGCIAAAAASVAFAAAPKIAVTDLT